MTILGGYQVAFIGGVLLSCSLLSGCITLDAIPEEESAVETTAENTATKQFKQALYDDINRCRRTREELLYGLPGKLC